MWSHSRSHSGPRTLTYCHLVLECGRWGGSSPAQAVCALPTRVTVLHRNGLSPATIFTWSLPLTVSQGLRGKGVTQVGLH